MSRSWRLQLLRFDGASALQQKNWEEWGGGVDRKGGDMFCECAISKAHCGVVNKFVNGDWGILTSSIHLLESISVDVKCIL